MSGNRGCLMNSLLFLIIVLVPLLGHIIVTEQDLFFNISGASGGYASTSFGER